MMTCTSERTGRASTGMVLTAQMPEDSKAAIISRTNMRAFTLRRMTFSIIGWPLRG